MNLLLKEYILSGDSKEAERCLRDLEVPHFHHEFVYEVNLTEKHTDQNSRLFRALRSLVIQDRRCSV